MDNTNIQKESCLLSAMEEKSTLTSKATIFLKSTSLKIALTIPILQDHWVIHQMNSQILSYSLSLGLPMRVRKE